MTPKVLHKKKKIKYKKKIKSQTKNKKTIQIHNFQQPSSCCSRQHSISHRPNLGIHDPLSRNLRPTSVDRRN
jgi:hypothetical protein